ncbi:MAG: lectin-like protein [Candidatus Poribacteria bacterium]|nr:lectin-like protein [Candidatus Poribacteria bacterium]
MYGKIAAPLGSSKGEVTSPLRADTSSLSGRVIDTEGISFPICRTEEVSTVGGIPLYIKSGVDIKDVTVTVRPRMHIRCRVLLADGTPLTDTTVKFDRRCQSLDDVFSGNFSRNPTYTDSDGHFVVYVNLPMFCTAAVDYQGDVATAETFKIGEGQRRHDLVFRLSEASSPPIPDASTPLPGDVQVPPPVPQIPNPIGAWVVNPINGHAYKKIQCKSWEDAKAMAVAEGAHLVSINDKVEQEWLVEIFGRDPFLIGLTRLENQTEWQWTSGEPVTYTNWVLQESATEPDALVFVSMTNAKWHIGTPENLQRISIALLEKEVDHLETK